MSSGLSFASIADTSGNSLNITSFSMYGTNVHDVYQGYQVLSQKKNDLLSLYNKELEIRKQSFEYKIENINESEIDNVMFLQKIISIKKKILDLKDEHKSLLEKYENINKDIKKMEDMETTYHNFSKMYLSLLNKKDDSKIVDDIISNIESKKLERYELDKQIGHILNEIARLKNIIRTDDLEDETNKSDLDLELNPALLCFTCNESHITHCFNPCGHSFCEKCVSRLDANSLNAICFMCRAKVSGKIKLYFS